MLKFLFQNAIKSPFKLFAICMVVYLATMSFFVAGLLALLAGSWLRTEIAKQRKAMEEAQAAERAEAAEAAKLATQRVAQATAAAANDDVANTTPPKRRYAKSAVVRPLKTGS
ncbi:hypothetical protein [Burkholderia sp. Ac-20353]|uniref:hypothetical protein n=1 Tax=Burkholderia sp. Ac-20353 TaxID=2703894 RepID=UPI00197B0879|nr:hypothetical protein [Burkholderia sp. Ac-20353]MBN3785693.1 hypothetical protein [Burkholderia sp. Ac-20353]